MTKNLQQLNSTNKKSKSTVLIVLGVIVALVVGVFIFMAISKNSAINDPITLEEIAKHNNKSDCWTTINGKVYDVTNFISRHKGGDKILNACGVDATDFFTGKSPIGRVHSKVAIKLLQKCKLAFSKNKYLTYATKLHYN